MSDRTTERAKEILMGILVFVMLPIMLPLIGIAEFAQWLDRKLFGG